MVHRERRMTDGVQAVIWDGERLRLLDQRQLPEQEAYLSYEDAAAVAEAIREMVVRGAPAIGIAAAYGAVLALLRAEPGSWQREFDERLAGLAATRPTAVNLTWALARMRGAVAGCDLAAARDAALVEAQAIHAEDVRANQAIAVAGAALLPEGSVAVTHCNAGALATGGIGTALGVLREAWRSGRLSEVLVGETRPWLQGARLTAWELAREGIPVTVLTDSAMAAEMQRRQPAWLVVGADRIAANGDTANKIGTYALAVAAHHHGARMMVAAPVSTLDLATPDGSGIALEERDGRELWEAIGSGPPPAGVTLRNPVFDVTPAALIDVIVTERGLHRPPYTATLTEHA
jgi:methylthioribose-1-phosphate isomerase